MTISVISSQRRNNLSYFYPYDGLGSTKALTDANQNAQASYIYDAWGNILQSSGTITNPYLYVGELGYYADGDTGMYLLTQRWYNPVVGKFVVRDPMHQPIGIMDVLYLYAEDNPILYADPSGYFKIPSLSPGMWICIGCIIGHITIPDCTCVAVCVRPSMGLQWILDCLGSCLSENYGSRLWELLLRRCGI